MRSHWAAISAWAVFRVAAQISGGRGRSVSSMNWGIRRRHPPRKLQSQGGPERLPRLSTGHQARCLLPSRYCGAAARLNLLRLRAAGAMSIARARCRAPGRAGAEVADAHQGRERTADAHRPGHARGRPAAPLLAAGGPGGRAAARRAARAAPHPGRGPGAVPRRAGAAGAARATLPAPRRRPELRPSGGRRPALPLSRLAVRPGGTLPGAAG